MCIRDSAITPYMVTKRELCEHPATLYPVYADYSCDTTTNICLLYTSRCV